LTVTNTELARIRRIAIQQGDRELRRTAFRFADEFRELRLRAGISQRAVARAIDVHSTVITRLERGDPSVGAIIRARACAVLGADFRLQLYPERSALLYDAAHARIIERLVKLAGPGWRVRLEHPLPRRRSIDACFFAHEAIVVSEVETRLGRLEAMQRELEEKREAIRLSFGAERPVHVVLVLPPTRRHRALVRDHPSLLRTAFPASSGEIRAAFADPKRLFPGDGILWVAGSR
jgi:transcriptional regulator with XRE-family HTH domain